MSGRTAVVLFTLVCTAMMGACTGPIDEDEDESASSVSANGRGRSVCGDGVCSAKESCSTCAQDCGVCSGPVGDTTAPTVAISSPTSGTTYTTAQTVAITASASDNVGVTKVEFFKGGTLVATDTSVPYQYAWTISSTDNGTHSFTAKAYDAAGNSATTATTSVAVNIATAPAAVCGDSICAATETCSSCSADCGACSSGTLSASAPVGFTPEDTDFSTKTVGRHSQIVRAASGSGYVHFWERLTCSGTSLSGCTASASNVVATPIDAAGNMSAPKYVAPLDLTLGYRRSLRAISHPNGYVVAWIQASATVSQVYYAFLDPSFNVKSISHFDAEGATMVRVAGDGTTVGLAWDTLTPHQRTYFSRIYVDGARSAAKSITSYFSHQLTTDLAWDGAQFGWAFENDREQLKRCGCGYTATGGAVEVAMYRLALDGTVLGTTLLSETIEEGMAFKSDVRIVARPAGGFVVTWISSPSVLYNWDVAVAAVSASGVKEGATRYVTKDGGATREATPDISRSAGQAGYLVSFGFASPGDKNTDSYGLKGTLLDANTNPVGSMVEVLPDQPGCIDNGGGSWPHTVYPTSTSAKWCYQAVDGGGSSGRMSMVGGPSGTALLVHPSKVYVHLPSGSGMYTTAHFATKFSF